MHRTIEAQRGTIAKLEASELALMGKIRDMDTTIFSMSHCDSWEQMRPYFQSLLADTIARRTDESNRIANLLIPEMQKAYRK